MISEFEQRLAEVLSGRLAPPLQGRVDVAPGAVPAAGQAPRLAVGVASATPLEPDVWMRRPELVPGSPSPRRVVKLRCDVRVDVRVQAAVNRQARMSAVDAALFALDHEDVRNGRAFAPTVAGADPGFTIQRLEIAALTSPRSLDDPDAAEFGLSLIAEGLFWPVGLAGEDGRALGEIRLRGVRMPLMLSGLPSKIIAGSAGIPLQLRLGAVGQAVLREGDQPIATQAFETLWVAAFGPGRRPAAGQLAGGIAGEGDVRLIPVTQDAASFTYTPPPTPAVEELIVGMAGPDGNIGPEIGHFTLTTRAS